MLTQVLAICWLAVDILAIVLSVRLEKAKAELKIARAELAKYRRPHDSKGRFTKG
jgi:hypothetical protein